MSGPGAPDRVPTPLDEDLVALAAGRLPPAAVARLEQVTRLDPATRERAAAIRAHLALYDAVIPSPPPPPFEAVRAARDAGAGAASARRARGPARPRLLAVAAAALVVAGAVALWATSGGESAAPPPLASGDAAAFRVARGSRTVALEVAAPGDVVTAARDATLRLREAAGAPTEVRLREGARLALLGDGHVALQDGVASFRVEHRPDRPFRVTTPAVIVEDRGTVFALDVSRPEGGTTRLLVTVEEGSVRANGVPVLAGSGLAFEGGKPLGAAWPLDAKPSLSLEGAPSAARPAVRLVLVNPTDGWIRVASPEDPESPVFLDVAGPDGSNRLVRVTPDLLEGGARLAGGIAPRARVELTVRLERTLTRPGTYRLRAVWKPVGSREHPTSPELVVHVP